MQTISREHFEAWVAAQPDDRHFVYIDVENCAIASFIKETTNIKNPTVGGSYWRESWKGDSYSFPPWLWQLMMACRSEKPRSELITIAQLKRNLNITDENQQEKDITNGQQSTRATL